MSPAPERSLVSDVLAMERWEDARATLLAAPLAFSSIEVRKLTAHLRRISQAPTPLRLAACGHYTLGMLKPYWDFLAALHGFELEYLEAPYGNAIQFFQGPGELERFRPDATLLLLRWEDLVPGYSDKLHDPAPNARAELAEECERRTCDLLRLARERSACPVLFAFLPPMRGFSLGAHDMASVESERAFRERVRARISDRLHSDLASVHWVDLEAPASELGYRSFFDARLWHSARFPFSVAGSLAVAQAVFTPLWVLRRTPKKVLVLDADNTLWGGIVGEDGPTGIKLGPDFPGSAYVEFQQRILDVKRRGFLLALASKNNWEDVRQILREHPHQVLREGDFSAMRVNWEPKPSNLRAMAAELGLGIDSFVFVDDSSFECKAMRDELPAVTTVQTPHDPLRVPFVLESFPELQILALTSEDRRRSEMYRAEKARSELQAQVSDPEEFLRSLRMKLLVGFDDEKQVQRIAQLTQKTNQFNLTTRRYTEAEILERMRDPSSRVAHFSLTDSFGDSGLVGVAIVAKGPDETAHIDTLLMSCRVIGRRAEQGFLRVLLQDFLKKHPSVVRFEGEYIPTAKNGLVERFFPENGFRPTSDGRYEVSAAEVFQFDVEHLPFEIEVTG